jgi:hypothetical protein
VGRRSDGDLGGRDHVQAGTRHASELDGGCSGKPGSGDGNKGVAGNGSARRRDSGYVRAGMHGDVTGFPRAVEPIIIVYLQRYLIDPRRGIGMRWILFR